MKIKKKQNFPKKKKKYSFFKKIKNLKKNKYFLKK